ncbi:MAG TPA: hypothetical protein VEI97_01885, partial [bacterium]|nr:hypothetical protein [bacterium]
PPQYTDLPPLQLSLDPRGRLRKLWWLIANPRRLFAEVSVVPDLMTPLGFLTLVGLAYLLIWGQQAYGLILKDHQELLAQTSAAILPMDQREGLAEQQATFLLWSAAAIGVNHVMLSGVYALIVFWIARTVGFQPKGYPEILGVMAFIWVPRPIYHLALDAALLSSGQYDSWWAVQQAHAELSLGIHALLPDRMTFTTLPELAAFYLLGPIDIFLVWAAVLLGIAGPYIFERPLAVWKLVGVSAILFVLLSAAVTRLKVPVGALQDAAQARIEQATIAPTETAGVSP